MAIFENQKLMTNDRSKK